MKKREVSFRRGHSHFFIGKAHRLIPGDTWAHTCVTWPNIHGC